MLILTPELLKEIRKDATIAERRRILKWIREKNAETNVRMLTANNETVYILYDHDLAELKRGET
jgi:hypothetical protein